MTKIIIQLKNHKFPTYFYDVKTLIMDAVGCGCKAVMIVNSTQFSYDSIRYVVIVNDDGTKEVLYRETLYDTWFPDRCHICDRWFRPWDKPDHVHYNGDPTMGGDRILFCSRDCFEAWEESESESTVLLSLEEFEHEIPISRATWNKAFEQFEKTVNRKTKRRIQRWLRKWQKSE